MCKSIKLTLGQPSASSRQAAANPRQTLLLPGPPSPHLREQPRGLAGWVPSKGIWAGSIITLPTAPPSAAALAPTKATKVSNFLIMVSSDQWMRQCASHWRAVGAEEPGDQGKDTDSPWEQPRLPGKQPAECPDILPQAPTLPEKVRAGRGPYSPAHHPEPGQGGGEGGEAGERSVGSRELKPVWRITGSSHPSTAGNPW